MGNTRAIQLQDPVESAIWHWNENIAFDVDVRDLPRGARLCLSIWALYGGKSKSKKKGKEVVICLSVCGQCMYPYC